MAPIEALHLAPHPDDESIAAPATLLALTHAGHRLVNVACSLGRSEHAARRRAELLEARNRAGFGLIILDPPLAISRGDDLQAAQSTLARWLAERIDSTGVELVISPSPHDGHYGHEVVGRAAREGIERSRRRPRWWAWGLWADLPLPTLVSEFGHDQLEEAVHVLESHAGELVRNDYADLVRCRAVTSRVLGAERAFGFGSRRLDAPFAELFLELGMPAGEWVAYEPRKLDSARPLDGRPADRRLRWWLDETSFRDRLEQT